ncbi:hypothetical protein CGLO_00842 [Colletotrichum gloeosporioides Cg-14]|uniref:Uncharacterized protein n=1 Tax=Colletotrichum gloeosporioides (strain Cg-14) TaxID=1237896 RepID=T0L2Y2_COLGC|nr:hypothetical protein CGLO_00842 [Colletotrichum gloeosporioides Cg-14]
MTFRRGTGTLCRKLRAHSAAVPGTVELGDKNAASLNQRLLQQTSRRYLTKCPYCAGCMDDGAWSQQDAPKSGPGGRRTQHGDFGRVREEELSGPKKRPLSFRTTTPDRDEKPPAERITIRHSSILYNPLDVVALATAQPVTPLPPFLRQRTPPNWSVPHTQAKAAM